MQNRFFRLLLSCILYLTVLHLPQEITAQTTLETRQLLYSIQPGANGLTRVNVEFTYRFVNTFGTIELIFDTKSKGNLEYQYNGRSFLFSGPQVGIRNVKPLDPKMQVSIQGPGGFGTQKTFTVMEGMGIGGIMGNGIDVFPNCKTSEQSNPANYRIIGIQVLGVSFENTSKVTAEIEEKLRNEAMQAKISSITSQAESAYNLRDYPKAIKFYEELINMGQSNPNTEARLNEMKQKMNAAKSKEKYDDFIKKGNEAERNGDFDMAEKYYNSAKEIPNTDNQAAFGAQRIRSKREEKDRKQQEEAKRIKEESIKQQEQLAKEEAIKDKKNKNALEEFNRKAEKELQKRIDSIQNQLDAESRQKMATERERVRKEEELKEKKREMEENEKDRKKEEAIKAEDQKLVQSIEGEMKWDPDAYLNAVNRAKKAMELAHSVKAADELKLKREWWDNNSYMQIFADDLYEPQRRDNFEKYHKKLFEESMRYYEAKHAYFSALHHVNKGSEEEKYILKQIEWCNTLIQSVSMEKRYSRKGEEQRMKMKEMAKIIAEGNRRQFNREKVEFAYAALDARAMYPAENLTKKYELTQRMNAAKAQYESQAFVAGVSNAVVMNQFLNDEKELDNGQGVLRYFNPYVSFGFMSTPMLLNQVSDVNVPQTTINNLVVGITQGGFDLWAYRSDFLDASIGGNLVLGMLPMYGSVSLYLQYGGKSNIDFGYKKVKIATSFELQQRHGKLGIDYDVFINTNTSGTSASNTISAGKFNYGNVRIGAGIKIDLGDTLEAKHFMVKVLAEKPSFYPESMFKKPVFSYMFEALFNSVSINFLYGKNYVIPGKKSNPLFETKNKDMFQLTISKYWTIKTY